MAITVLSHFAVVKFGCDWCIHRKPAVEIIQCESGLWCAAFPPGVPPAPSLLVLPVRHTHSETEFSASPELKEYSISLSAGARASLRVCAWRVGEVLLSDGRGACVCEAEELEWTTLYCQLCESECAVKARDARACVCLLSA